MKFPTIELIVFIVICSVCYIVSNFIIEGDISLKINIYAVGGAVFAAFIALRTLMMTQNNNERNNFDNKFNLLLEQHNEQLKNVLEFIDKNKASTEVTPKLMASYDYSIPNNYLFSHPIFSPYMRVLYHILKSIYIDYRPIDNKIESEKKYSSLVRSLIRNDLLYFIAINVSSNKNANFKDFLLYLQRYDFFEHLNLNKPLHHNDNNYSLEPFDIVVKEIANKLNDYIERVIKIAIIKECDLCVFLFHDEINYLNGDSFHIKTPAVYRFCFLFNEIKFISMNRILKEKIREVVSECNVNTRISKHKLNYRNKKRYLFLGERLVEGYSLYCKSGSNRVYLKNELREIVKNKETFEKFTKRIAYNYDIQEHEILFSRVSDKIVGSSSDFMGSEDLYRELLRYNISNIVSIKNDIICRNVIVHLENFLNSQGVFIDQDDSINF